MISLYYNHDYVVREVPMETGIHGYVVLDDEGRVNIYINEKDPEARRLRSFKHEVIHSTEDDFYSTESEDTIERRTRLLEKSTTIYVRNWGVWVKRSEGA